MKQKWNVMNTCRILLLSSLLTQKKEQGSHSGERRMSEMICGETKGFIEMKSLVLPSRSCFGAGDGLSFPWEGLCRCVSVYETAHSDTEFSFIALSLFHGIPVQNLFSPSRSDYYESVSKVRWQKWERREYTVMCLCSRKHSGMVRAPISQTGLAEVMWFSLSP